MSHTNETTYYSLPQYVGSDIINPLVDTNGAYEQIDTVMHNIATAASGAVTDASDAKTAVENMESTVEGHTASIETNAEAIADVNGVIAPNFNSGETYAKGDIVIYTDGKAYQFTASHTGAWTGLDVNRVVVGDAIKELEDSVDEVNSTLTNKVNNTFVEEGVVLSSGAVISSPKRLLQCTIESDDAQYSGGSVTINNVRVMELTTQALNNPIKIMQTFTVYEGDLVVFANNSNGGTVTVKAY